MRYLEGGGADQPRVAVDTGALVPPAAALDAREAGPAVRIHEQREDVGLTAAAQRSRGVGDGDTEAQVLYVITFSVSVFPRSAVSQAVQQGWLSQPLTPSVFRATTSPLR